MHHQSRRSRRQPHQRPPPPAVVNGEGRVLRPGGAAIIREEVQARPPLVREKSRRVLPETVNAVSIGNFYGITLSYRMS